MVDLHTIVPDFFRFVGEEPDQKQTHGCFGTALLDGQLLLRCIQRVFPSSFWSQFPLTDAGFHGVFLFTKSCSDAGLFHSSKVDSLAIIENGDSENLGVVLNNLMSSSSDQKNVVHAGPISEDSSVCTCLLCRWSNAVRVMSPSSHAWSPSKLPNSLRRLVEDGVPTGAREHAWLILSGGLNLKRSRKPDYVSMCQKALTACVHLELIDLDISRTFQEYPDWRLRGLDVITRRVLAAYSLRNRTVGYCQGLSYIAGLLVSVVSEEVAFVILSAIIEDGLLPPDYYTTLQGAVIDRRVLESLIAQFLPELTQVLGDAMEDYSFISIPWNMCLFSTSLPMPVSVRVWDFLFAFGPCVMFRVALGLLHELESALVVQRMPISEIREKLKEIEQKTTVSDVALYCSQFSQCSNELVASLRARLREKDETKTQMSVRADEALSVSDDTYFGHPSVAHADPTARKRKKESKKLALAGLASFMGNV